MALTLYVGSKRYSSWSLRPYLALAHTGTEFECKTILLDQSDSKANIGAVSPTNRVPVLHHDGLVVPESLAICEYVADVFPAAQLWPSDRTKRAKARAIATEMHGGFAPLRREMSMDLCAKKPGRTYSPEALADVARVQTIWREALAASGGPFLFGTFTIADAMYAPVATRFVTYAVDMDATCRAYVDAIYALPGMKQWQADAEREPKTRD